MMNYEEFKQTVKEELEKIFPKEYEINIKTVQKVNQELDGLIVRRNEKSNVSPTIYLNALYKDYENGKQLGEIVTDTHFVIMDNMSSGERITELLDFDTANENIIFELINTEKNQSLLQQVPSRTWNELSIVYRWIIRTTTEGTQSAIITPNLAERLGLNEEQLFDLAKENTKRIRPVLIEPLGDVIRELLKEDIPEQMLDVLLAGNYFPELYVITNNVRTCGAASILCEDELHKLSEQLGTDLYILPSSIHEMLAISTDFGTPEEITQMVQEVNMEEVEPEEQLSNNVYNYDRETREITMVTDAPAIGKEQDLDTIKVQTAPAQDDPARTNPILGRSR